MREFLTRPERDGRPSRRERHEAGRHEWAAPLWRERARRYQFPACTRDVDADVVIIGGGFTGLWTAFHLKKLDPRTEIVLLEARQPGFGASGRNGGWCSALFPVEAADIARRHGDAAVRALHEELVSTVGAVGSFLESNRIDAGWVRGGSLSVATNGAQVERLRASLASRRGTGLDDHSWLDADDVLERIRVTGALGAVFDPNCAALDPQALLDGLLDVVIPLGVRIFGDTRVTEIGRGHLTARTPEGLSSVTARNIVVATEAWTAALPRQRRSVVPLYSYVVATEPLPEDVWSAIGWGNRETLAEGRNMVTYAQRTADGRIVFGGRGAPYAFGSDIHSRLDSNSRVHRLIETTMHQLFPVTTGARITHRWGGPLAVPRDWHPSVREDQRTGATIVGGYVGDGVALSHLTGRIAAHRLLAVDDPVLRLPVNSHSSRRWEPEPLRWLGINAGLATTRLADARERRTGRVSRNLTRLMRLF